MKKTYYAILYVILSIGTLVLASGGPTPWTGTGGGGG
jgi:hypothetical protein